MTSRGICNELMTSERDLYGHDLKSSPRDNIWCITGSLRVLAVSGTLCKQLFHNYEVNKETHELYYVLLN
jgi:hypothetical protein